VESLGSIENLIRITGCSETTARRWPTENMTESARRMIGYHVCNGLAIICGKDWANFKFANGKLFARRALA
jgi:hypothetical protein